MVSLVQAHLSMKPSQAMIQKWSQQLFRYQLSQKAHPLYYEHSIFKISPVVIPTFILIVRLRPGAMAA